MKFRIVEESTEDEIIEGATDTAKRPTIWNDPTGAAESQIWDEGQGRYRSMTDAEHAENNKPETT
ncbi:hypothetical protein [Polaromonas sp. UC242_47]|uniref:hypothetical protein n=1 Tax=Polaromonas sp. UC242_47 TaxID=3374626 RepID=UPI0037A8A689